MAETITLELTAEEVIVLQELASDLNSGYAWLIGIGERIREKALAAYRKPAISREEYYENLANTRKRWEGSLAEDSMVEEERTRLRFFYKIEGEEGDQ